MTSHAKRDGARRYVRGTPDQRFDAYLKTGSLVLGMDTPCIEWTGLTNAKGYGRFNDGTGTIVLAHRYALQRVQGPDERPVLHACDNPLCALERLTGTPGFNDWDNYGTVTR